MSTNTPITYLGELKRFMSGELEEIYADTYSFLEFLTLLNEGAIKHRDLQKNFKNSATDLDLFVYSNKFYGKLQELESYVFTHYLNHSKTNAIH